MQRAVLDRANELSVQIARRLLERLPASAAFSAFLEGLGAELRNLPVESRNRLAASGTDHPLDVVAAASVQSSGPFTPPFLLFTRLTSVRVGAMSSRVIVHVAWSPGPRVMELPVLVTSPVQVQAEAW